jgi:hypothetical protein
MPSAACVQILGHMATLQTTAHRPRGRRDAVAAAGALLLVARALNGSRSPDHREALALAIAAAEDSFRLRDHELPAARTDSLLDAVTELQSAAESSTQGYEVACAELDRLWRLEAPRPLD